MKFVIALFLSQVSGIKLAQKHQLHGDPIAPVTFDNNGCRDTYDHSHSVSAGPSACNSGPTNLPVEKEAKKIAKETEDATQEGEAKVAAKEANEVAEAKASIAKSAKAAPAPAKSAAAATPAKSALIQLQWDTPADPTFKDKNHCVHTYVSPRVAYDMGLDHPLECPKGGPEEQSNHVPTQKDSKKEAAAPEAKKAPEESAAVQIRFVDGYDRMVEESAELAQGPDFSKPPTPTFQDTSKCVHKYVSPNPDLMQPDPECPGGDPRKQQQAAAPAKSLAQGPDFSKPPTPSFNDSNKCVHKYVSPNPDLMQPDPECPEGKKQQQQASSLAQGPRIPSLIQVEGGPDFSKPPRPTFPDANACTHTYVSPNPDLMQPDPACPPKPADKNGDPLTKQEGPSLPQ